MNKRIDTNSTQQAAAPRCASLDQIIPYLAHLLAGKAIIPADACFFLLASHCTHRAEDILQQTDPELVRIDAESNRILEEYGLESSDLWEQSDLAPPAYQKLTARWEARAADIVIEELRKDGGAAIADLYEHNREEFNCRYNLGRAWFMEPGGIRPEAKA